MLKILNDISYEKIDIKKFGIVFSAILLIISIFLFYKDSHFYLFTVVAFAILLFFSILFPMTIKPIYAVWMTLGTFLGIIMTAAILTFIFYFIMFPISAIARILNKQFLDLKLNKEINSYWNDRDSKPKDINSYENQF